MTFFSGHSQPVRAQERSTVIEIALESLNDAKPIRLSGIYSNDRLDFYLPESFMPGDSSALTLDIETSPMLDLEHSSITVEINDLNITSLKLADFVNGRMTAQISASVFKQGVNTILLNGGLFLPDDRSNEFKNWNDPARWVNLKASSQLAIELLPNEEGYTLNSVLPVFGNTYRNQATGQPMEQTVVILPDDVTSDDLTALASLSYAIGGLTDLRPVWEPKVVYESDFVPGMANDMNIILINVYDSGLMAYTSEVKDYLQVARSPINPQKAVLLIADHDRTDGKTPADIFSHPDRRVLLQGVKVYLNPSMHSAAEPEFKPAFSLETIGYQDQTVYGVGDNDLIYKVFIPYGVHVTDATFNLILSHAPDLDRDSYRLNVFINGKAIAGIILNQKTAVSQPIGISLPVARLRPGVNYLRVSFNLQLGNTAFEISPENIWATISNQSNLIFNTTPANPVPSLSNFPMPFSDNPSSLIVVPDHPDAAMLEKLTTFSGGLGQAAVISDRPVRMYQAKDYRTDNKVDKNIILVGTLASNPVIKAFNPFLPQAFTDDGGSLAPGYGVYLTVEEQPVSLGVIQTLRSPLNVESTLLIAAGTDEKGLSRTLNLLADRRRWPSLQGNLVLLGAGTLLNHNDQADENLEHWQLARVSSIPIIGTYLQSIAPSNLVPAVVSIIAALILLLVLMVILKFGQGRK